MYYYLPVILRLVAKVQLVKTQSNMELTRKNSRIVDFKKGVGAYMCKERLDSILSALTPSLSTIYEN